MKQKFLRAVNLPYHIANHVIGEHHTPTHRRIAGFIVMLIGVSIAHVSAHAHLLLTLAGDLVGYSIHATGAIPFLHDIENATKVNNDCKNCKA